MVGTILFGLGAVFLLVRSRTGYTVQTTAIVFPLVAFLLRAFPGIRYAVERYDTFGVLWIGFITIAVIVGTLLFAYALVRHSLRPTPNV